MTPHTTAATTWTATLGQLEMLVTRANFDTWLRDTVGLRHDDTAFVVGAQNDFAIEWLSTRLRPLIAKTLARVVGRATDVRFEVIREEEPSPPVLLADDVVIPPQFRKRPAPPALHPAMTFDTFVVGEENEMAAHAARAAATAAGAPNPLVIFGASGLGKTHLLNAIGHEAHAAGRAVMFVTAERFGNDYVRALSSGLDAFRSRYRGCDTLVVDDVQFFEGKEKFQGEFFHAFNELHAAGKRIVLACDRAPSALSGMSEALRSRMQWGLVADLQKPGFETRLAILRAKSRNHALQLGDDALQQIAGTCCPTVRELEGYLNRVLAYVPLVGGEVTPQVIDRALSALSAPASHEPPSLAPDAVLEAVSRRTGASIADMRGRTRNREIAYARHMAMFLLKEETRCTVAEIGRLLGNRDHSTVLGGIARINIERTTRAETSADLHAIRATLAAPPATRAVAG